jgi:phosphoglycolate phosphatase
MTAGPVLLTDLDNTIYNWVDFYAPCFRAMLHAVAARTGVAEADLVPQFKAVFTAYASVEYPYCIQKLKICGGLPKDEVRALVRAGRVAFGRARRRRLVPYPGVQETLLWAKSNNIPVIAVSNAPWYASWRRLWNLGLKGLFAGIAAGPGFPVEQEDEYAEDARCMQATFEPALKWIIPSGELKPSPRMYSTVIGALSLRPEDTWVVGDSLSKDIAPALALGAVGVWAEYGTRYDEANFRTLLGVTHWSPDKVEAVYEGTGIRPSITIKRFDELRELIPTVQRRLWT